jgi:hypothetical protein
MAVGLLLLDRLVIHAERQGTAEGLALLVGEMLLGLLLYVGLMRVLAPDTIGELTMRARQLMNRSEATT